MGNAVISKACHYCPRKLSDCNGHRFFLVPHKVLDGGVIGIALIANYVLGLHIGFVIILCSIPMFAAAWILNREIFYNSLSGMLISSFVIDLLSSFRADFLDLFAPGAFPSALLGRSLIRTGLGIMLRNNASTGGPTCWRIFSPAMSGLMSASLFC